MINLFLKSDLDEALAPISPVRFRDFFGASQKLARGRISARAPRR